MRFSYIVVALLVLIIRGAALAQAPAQASVEYPPIAGEVLASGDWGVLWTCGSTNKVKPDTAVPHGKGLAVRISAASNEYEPFQLVMRPSKQLGAVKVIPHGLVGPRGAKIDAWNIEVNRVEYVNVVEPTSPDVLPGLYPDPLPDFEPFTATNGTNSAVWVTVYVPRKTAAGEYRGSIDISAQGMSKLTVPIRLRVWDFELPWVSKLRTAYGCDFDDSIATYQGATTLEQKRKLVDLYNKEFHRHRVSPRRPYAFYDIKPAIEGERLKLDFSDFDIAVQKYFAMFNSFALPGFAAGDNLGLDMGDDYDRYKVGYMRAVVEHLADKGQIKKGFAYLWDEPQDKAYPAVTAAADLCRKADGRIKVMVTEPIEPTLVGSVDMWCPLVSDRDDEAAFKARQAKGDEMWWYVCCGPHHPYPNNFIDYPAIDQRILPWITWRYDVAGILYWETTYWSENPWDSAMSRSPWGGWNFGNGDGRLLYPPVRKASSTFVDKKPISSIRWEMVREGIEDYDYFHILKDRMQKARKANHSDSALAQADEALRAVDACALSRTDYARDPARLEAVRAQVAKAIEGLSNR